VKYQRSAVFISDYSHLSTRERELFADAVRQMNAAYDQAGGNWPPRWPASLRVKAVQGAPGIWEMTWSFSGPDGRATFEIVTVEGEPAIRWRRIGGHEVFGAP
jgi:hypothetical protein